MTSKKKIILSVASVALAGLGVAVVTQVRGAATPAAQLPMAPLPGMPPVPDPSNGNCSTGTNAAT